MCLRSSYRAHHSLQTVGLGIMYLSEFVPEVQLSSTANVRNEHEALHYYPSGREP